MASYFTRFKTLTDELDCLSTKPTCTCAKCTCEINSKFDAYEQTSLLTQFLMGLSDQYTTSRGQILIMKLVPTISQCYVMLLQEENKEKCLITLI